MLNYFLDTQAFTSMAKMNDLSMCFCIQILKDGYRAYNDKKYVI